MKKGKPIAISRSADKGIVEKTGPPPAERERGPEHGVRALERLMGVEAAMRSGRTDRGV